MDDEDRLSFLERRVRAPFQVRWVGVEPGGERTCDGPEWLGALVVVELGSIEVEGPSGLRCSFDTGGVLCLSRLPRSTLRNRGPDLALLAVVSRRPDRQTDEFPADRGRSGDGSPDPGSDTGRSPMTGVRDPSPATLAIEERAVTSRDGTRIAFDRMGDGPAVILVGGATMVRQGNGALAEALASGLTVLNYDRRGRGGSGDTPPYALQREIEDIDALIADAGGSAHLFGISSGGALALEAAAAGLAVDRLAVYEVPYGLDGDQPRRQVEYVANLERAARSGRPGAMMEIFLRVVGADDAAVEATRGSPAWPGLVAVEHTLAYDAACLGTGQPPVDRLGSITTATLVLTGAPDGGHEVLDTTFFEDAARAIVAGVPSAEHRRIPNQSHQVDPQALASVLAAFYRGEAS